MAYNTYNIPNMLIDCLFYWLCFWLSRYVFRKSEVVGGFLSALAVGIPNSFVVQRSTIPSRMVKFMAMGLDYSVSLATLMAATSDP